VTGYWLAWVGLAQDDEQKSVTPGVRAGYGASPGPDERGGAPGQTGTEDALGHAEKGRNWTMAATTESRTTGLHDGDNPFADLAAAYLEALLAGERQQASERVMKAVEEGVSVKEIYLHVFQSCQREIGGLWQRNEVTVAEEHYVTAATQLIMSQLYPRIFGAEKTGRSLVATCVGGELHEIGVRMVADFFEMEGWDTYYLGANTPTESILETLESRQPDLLGISATITFNLDEVIDLVKEVRSAETGDGLPILVGGRPFLKTEGLWERVGADGYAPDAQEAVQKAEELLAR